MLHIYESDRLETLFESFSELLVEHESKSILQPIKIIVPNQDTGRWLHLKIADKYGISAFIQPILPAYFIHELNLKIDESYEDKLADKNEYTWRIYEILYNRSKDYVFKHLTEYSEGDTLKRFQLAGMIADLFDQYVLFRPEMILSWNQGLQVDKNSYHETWQMALWIAIKSHDCTRLDRASLYKELASQIELGKLDYNSTLFLFNPGMFPPSYARIFALLSKTTTVHWFRTDTVNSNDSPINHLVSLLGEDQLNASRMLQDVFRDIPNTKIVLNSSNYESGTTLKKLQSSIKNKEASFYYSSDNSIQIHACHNTLREVQVLQDAIYDFLEHTQDAGPGDILVVTSDLSSYSGFIDSVFNSNIETSNKLPIFINDVGNTLTSQIITFFLEIISVHQSRFKITPILDLIGHRVVKERFGLTDQNISLMEKWLIESGLRWGLDADYRGDNGIHSWEFAIDRLIVGFMLPHYNQNMSLSIVPYSEVEGSEGLAIVGFLYQIKSWFSSWLSFFSESHSAIAWEAKLRECLNFWVLDTSDNRKAISLIQNVLLSFKNSSNFLSKMDAIPAEIVLEFVKANLNSTSAGSSYRTGAITFSSMVPVRHLPYRFIAVLGLNENSFPGNDIRNSFDLMQKEFLPGDRSVRITNKGLFLDSLMAATDVFFMSYTGFKLADGSSMPPSQVINDLLEYVKKEGGTIPIIKHRLHAFHPDYLKQSSNHFTYQSKNKKLSKRFIDINPPKYAGERIDVSLIISENEISISLDELYLFFRKPFTWLTKIKLGLKQSKDDTTIDDRDIFSLNKLDLWKLNQMFMDSIKRNEEIVTLYNRFVNSGLLPYGILAESTFKESINQFMDFWEAIPYEIKSYATGKTQPIETQFRIKDKVINFKATVPEIVDNKLIFIQASSLNQDRKLYTWLVHLCANLETKVETQAVYRSTDNSSFETLKFAPIEEAKKQISKMLEYMISLKGVPIPAYPKMFTDYESSLGKKNIKYEMVKELTLKQWHNYFNISAFDESKTVFNDDKPIRDYLESFNEAWYDEIISIYELVWSPMNEDGEGL